MLKPGFFLGIDAWAIVFVIMIMAFGLINLLHYFLKSQYLSSILVHAPSPWIIVNLKASRLDKLSHNFAKDFGLPTSERPTLDLVLSCFSNLSAFDFLKWLGEDNHENQVAEWLTKTINGKTYILKRIYLNTTLAFIWFEDQTTLAELKDALAQNQEQQHFIESILNELPFPVWCRDEKTHMLTFINNTYVDFVGQTKEAILAQQIDVYRASKNRISIDAQAKQHFIVDGSRVLFEFHETHDPYNNLIVGFGVDITPQEILQNELKQNISSNHELLEYLSTGIAIYSPDMRLKFFNHAYAKLTEPLGSFLHTEPTIGEVIEQLRRHRLLPEMTDFQSYKKRQMSLFTSISTPIHELSYLPNGQILRMIIAPYPLGGLIFMFEDITERISLESQYNTLIAVQKATIDNLFEGVAVFSSDNRLKISNPSFRRIWKLGEAHALPGTRMAEVMDETKDLFFIGGDWSEFRERMIDNITNRTPKMGVIKRLDERVVEFAYVPLPDGANMVRYFDITDTTKVEMALRERNEALETTDRLKSQFVANVSYELRSPLNTVIGFSEIMLNEYFGTLNLKQKEYMHGIYEASKQLLDLINGILDLASIEAGQMILKKEIVNIPEILQKSVNLVERFALEHKHNIKIEINGQIPSIMGDERQLQQVFHNLLSNAIKFTPDNGNIVIKATAENDTIIVDVLDTGVGIDSKDQNRIFDKFERINTMPQAGVGLGLALVKNFIELHQGTVHLMSKPGKGTKITCRLPLHLSNQIAS